MAKSTKKAKLKQK